MQVLQYKVKISVSLFFHFDWNFYFINIIFGSTHHTRKMYYFDSQPVRCAIEVLQALMGPGYIIIDLSNHFFTNKVSIIAFSEKRKYKQRVIRFRTHHTTHTHTHESRVMTHTYYYIHTFPLYLPTNMFIVSTIEMYRETLKLRTITLLQLFSLADVHSYIIMFILVYSSICHIPISVLY